MAKQILTRLEMAIPGVTVLRDITAESRGEWTISAEAAKAYWSDDVGVYAIPIIGRQRKLLIAPEDIGKSQGGMWPTKPLPDGYTWRMGKDPFGQPFPDCAFLDREKIISEETARQATQLDAIEAKLDTLIALWKGTVK